MKIGKYSKFVIMMAVSFIVMYAVMFLNVADVDHVMMSPMRIYMTSLMIASMAVVMLLFMLGMYTNKNKNIAILIVGIVGFAAFFYMERNQSFISDEEYMRAMIPHHSSAILTSQQAHLKDPEVKKLAKEIIEAQKREIAQMKQMLDRLERAEK